MSPLLRFLARYVRQNVPQYAVGGAMLFATNYAVVRIPALIGEALNVLETAGPTALQQGRSIALELLVWAAVLIIVRTLSRVLFFNPGREVEYRLGVDLFRHLLSLQRPFYGRHKVGELVSIATNDTQSARLLAGFAGLQVCNVAVAIPLHLYQMLRTDVVLTIWCLAPVAVGGLYMRWTIARFYTMVRASLGQLARLSERVLETYAGIAAVRAHVAEDAAVERFEERNQDYLRLLLRIAAVRAFSMPVLWFSGLVGAGIVLWVGGNRVLEGAIRVGHLATFTALLISLTAILASLAWVLAALSRGIVALGRIDDLLETRADLPPTSSELALDGPPRIEIRELSFRYPESEALALDGISVSVEPGNTLGIFGFTGSGKSTLIDLLARVHTPPPGTIAFDGRDIRDAALEDVRSTFAIVPQSAFLFSTSLRENVRLSGERSGHDRVAEGKRRDRVPEGELTDGRLEAVLRAAALEEDLANLPEGLDTIVGERGVMLSGGQRQRVALARALYRERPVLLLDDVLSAVDQTTEERLVRAIRGLRSERRPPTTVVVSHRTSVLEHADEIVVLEAGRIVERGTHPELLALDGIYARAHRHQNEDHG